MIKYEGRRDICSQFYKFNGQLHDEMIDIVNNEIAPKLKGGRKVLRLMHFHYETFGCGRYALHLEIGVDDGRVWITGHTGWLNVDTVTSSPLQDIDNRYLAVIIDEALYAIGKKDDGICGLIDADKYTCPKKLDYSCAR